MYEKVKAYVRKYAMLEQSDHVITGISGGADSVCLLFVLKELQEEYGFKLTGVHVNHCLRGDEADADETFVKELCEREQIALEIYRVNVKQIQSERGISAEEAGREIRREAFADAMHKFAGTKIALAHHMNDCAETVLLNLSRGTGAKGLAGIRPVNGKYIRPLLCVKREEIEVYLGEKGQSFCIDRTNLEDIYTRNRIRNQVIPYLEEHINEKAVEHIQKMAEQMASLSDYLERQTMKAYERCVVENDFYSLDIKMLLKEDEALRPYIIKKMICRAAGREKDIETVHVRQVEGLLELQTGKRITLPYNLLALRSYDKLIITLKEDNMLDEEKEEPQVEMRVFECDKIPDSFPESPYTKWFDYDIIKNTVVIRNQMPEDYITIDKDGNTQKIKKYFVNAKIPKEQRNQVLLAADGNHILWIIGYRQNQMYQVSENTKRILEIKIERRKKIEQ